MNAFDPASPSLRGEAGPGRLSDLVDIHPSSPTDTIVISNTGRLSLGELRLRINDLAETLRESGVAAGHPVGNLVTEGPSSIVVMFAVWAVGAVYVPINRRFTPDEVAKLMTETPIALMIGTPRDLDQLDLDTGIVSYDYDTAAPPAEVRRPATQTTVHYEPNIALVLRTSGTTGRPKAVLLRHTGTLEALDASLNKLRRSGRTATPRPVQANRVNLIPVSLALWAGIFNTLFSLRAGFGVVLLDRFTPASFARVVREHDIKSTVLAPAMITMLNDDRSITDLSPLRLVRSITAPLSPAVARQFHERFGVFVLNSYGQTELGGEVVGWTSADLRNFGETKLGAVGRAYDHVDLRIRRSDGTDAEPDEAGEIVVRSPFRMGGYALADGNLDDTTDERFVDGYLRTGDIGRVDPDGFLWIEGRVSDMISRGGLKIFPDEVEEIIRRHPTVRDVGVAGLPDHRLGEVPHAWVVSDEPIDDDELSEWCRRYLAPYKVPSGFSRVSELPRSDIGKLLRRELAAQYPVQQGADVL